MTMTETVQVQIHLLEVRLLFSSEQHMGYEAIAICLEATISVCVGCLYVCVAQCDPTTR